MAEPEQSATRRSDLAWGRVTGARPPLAAWVPIAGWLAMAVALTLVVALVVRGPGPLDDPDPADQRTGFLSSLHSATRVAPATLPGSPVGRSPIVVIFDRRPPPAKRLAAVFADLPRGVAAVLVLPRGEPPGTRSSVPVLADPGGRVAQAVRIHRPLDRGRPVGYAVIDRHGRVRYATLEPHYLDHRFELDLITKAAQ